MAKTIQLQGVKELLKSITSISQVLKPDVVRKHMRKGANIIAAEGRLNAATIDDTGELSKSIAVVENPEDPTGVIIGPRRSKTFRQGYFAHLYEFGAAPHTTRPGVSHPGMIATPFFRPAWDLKQNEALQKIKNGLQKEVTNTLTLRKR